VSLSAREENAKALAKLFGLDDDEAAALLKMTIRVRAGSDRASQATRQDIVDLLTRTVGRIVEAEGELANVEVVVGDAVPSEAARVVRVGVTDAEVVVSCDDVPEHDGEAAVPRIVLLIAACYAAGMAVRLGFARPFPLPYADTIRIPVDRLLRGREVGGPVNVGKLYVAGAGAIGNGFLRGLALFDLHGELHIVDPKRVTSGNLGRCVWFEDDDVSRPKAESLVARAQPSMPAAILVPRVGRLQDLQERSNGPWLERLVVAVDSRRARRGLQEELPRDVFDASTTGIEEVVFHFNQAPTEHACLSCIYVEDPVEEAHEKHVAAMLGIEVIDVREHYIGDEAARRMALRHPQLDPALLVGSAYDTLFKTLCATGQLGVDEGRTVLAPFSFVSVLAGAYLALELVLRASSADVTYPFNYWRASPWTSPISELQSLRPARPKCETCGNEMIRATVNDLWRWGGKKAG
jgi:hypothetical protein